MDIFQLFISAIFVNNIVLAQYLGNCPYLGCSKERGVAFGMGVAVIFVTIMATLFTWLAQTYVLDPFGIAYLQTLAFILIIAALVQFVEMFLKKVIPPLYKSLGIFLPLITTNCAVLGVCEMVIGDMSSILGAGVTMNTGWAILYAVFAGLGFTLVMIIMSGLREKIDCYGNMPKALKGFPIAMITASIICMAFTVFSYITI